MHREKQKRIKQEAYFSHEINEEIFLESNQLWLPLGSRIKVLRKNRFRIFNDGLMHNEPLYKPFTEILHERK